MSKSDLDLMGLDADERVVDLVTLSKSFPWRPTLFIGLGGTGCITVSKVKELFHELVTPEVKKDLKAKAPDIDNLYSFCAFDTAQQERPSGLNVDEWEPIVVNNLPAFREGIGRQAFFQDWMIKNYPVNSITTGAGGFRNLGRLAFIANINRINEKLQKKINQIMQAASKLKVQDQKPIVYVFCSVSGGTGSGTLLDLCFLLRNLSSADISGFVAVMDGLPNIGEAKAKEVKINTFCAIKELDAFMNITRNPVGKYRSGDLLHYPLGVTGKIVEPFDECYLVSPYRSDGAKNLPDQHTLTSFMARFAFMTVAFAFNPEKSEQSPSYAGLMVNYKTHLQTLPKGVAATYLVPGLAQASFPMETVASLITLESALDYLRFQVSGNPDEQEQMAREFLTQQKLDHHSIRNRIKINPQDPSGGILEALSYDDQVKSMLKGKQRYENSQEILELASNMISERLKEIKDVLDSNINTLLKEKVREIRSKVNQLLVDIMYRGVGTLDFLQDLSRVLSIELENMRHFSRQSDERYQLLEQNWQSIKSIIEDVVTDDGLLDTINDALKIPKAQLLYTDFLNEAETVALDKARNDLTQECLSLLITEVKQLSDRLSRFITEEANVASKKLEEGITKLYTRLFRQTEGQENTVLGINSFNVMSQQWMEEYKRSRGLNASQVLINLMEVETSIGGEVMMKFHPAKLMELRPPKGAELGIFLAQVIVDLIAPFYEDIRRWSPLDVIERTGSYRGDKPHQIIAGVLSKILKPQMELNLMEARLECPTMKLFFSGGITQKLKTELEQTPEMHSQTLRVAENHEPQRINFFNVTLPVAVAGCDMVALRLHETYLQWLESLQKMDSKRQQDQKELYHCFPGSHQWPSPVRWGEGIDDPEMNMFARAYALSEMHRVSAEDESRMNKVKKFTEVRYALFQLNKGSLWLWPFFTPHKEDTIKGKPVSLSSNVFDAWLEFRRKEEHKNNANAWVNWFSDNWMEHYTSPEVKQAKQKAIDSFLERKGRANDPRWIEVLDMVIENVNKWELG